MTHERIILEPNEDGVYEASPSAQESRTSAGKAALKPVGRFIISACVLAAVMLLLLTFVKGGVWVGQKIYPGLSFLSQAAMLFTIFFLAPLTLFKRTRAFGGFGIFAASYVFGLTLWVWSLILTFKFWGIFAVILGLFFAGVGIVPIGLLATLFHGEWSTVGQLILLMAFVPASRSFGISMVARAMRERGQ